MAGGWTRDGAVQDQIDDSIADAVTSARAQLPDGPGELYCVECDEEIPAVRREALPGVTTCVACQEAIDRRSVPGGGINRRGSKDSQLK
ncbi:DksA/TraR family C4-type zinc finger protein [Rhodovibrio salinarum]|uniref:DksA/TraR family C4-type zinc finger protein n=1 Tax=Rhodovibrio salinarum TaxID=1087 RepID=A0A934UZ14_9PROT|nr:DksA/TraR family C4-type zinc finger protein [Rhodovibrio salinarum]MBK1695860.1 DksA/TraR family C4-type zinc finger protein [Rhodovibrio salinarum]